MYQLDEIRTNITGRQCALEMQNLCLAVEVFGSIHILSTYQTAARRPICTLCLQSRPFLYQFIYGYENSGAPARRKRVSGAPYIKSGRVERNWGNSNKEIKSWSTEEKNCLQSELHMLTTCTCFKGDHILLWSLVLRLRWTINTPALSLFGESKVPG